MALKIKKGDTVQVIAGKDKGARARSSRSTARPSASSSRASTASTSTPRPVRPRGHQHRRHRHEEAPIHVSNVMVVDPRTSRPASDPRRERRRTAGRPSAPASRALGQGPLRDMSDTHHQPRLKSATATRSSPLLTSSASPTSCRSPASSRSSSTWVSATPLATPS
jgi:large subunit ribosomal protein L24